MDGLDRDTLVVWGLTLVAAVIAALSLAASVGGQSSNLGSAAQLRELEMRGQLKLFPNLGQDVGAMAGQDAQGGPALSWEAVEEAARSDVTPPTDLISIAAVAVAIDDTTTALAALDELARRDQEQFEPHANVAITLDNLASGRQVEELNATVSALTRRGASPWLTHQLRAVAATRRGDVASAESESEKAKSIALRFFAVLRLLGGIGLFILVLGGALVVGWPFLRRALDGANVRGLADAPSPFVLESSQRVMVLWFLMHMSIGVVLGGISFGLGGGDQVIALSITLQSLLGGGVAIYLVQVFGRRDADLVPLSIPLRLGITDSTRGYLGLCVWIIGGVSMGLIFELSGAVLSGALVGAPNQPQVALELFTSAAAIEVRLALLVSIVVFAPLFEEILFRGFLYRNLRDTLGVRSAMIVSSLLFGLVHLQLGLVLPLAGLGLAMCLVYERSGSLLPAIGVHAVWNGGQLVLVTLLMSGGA